MGNFAYLALRAKHLLIRLRWPIGGAAAGLLEMGVAYLLVDNSQVFSLWPIFVAQGMLVAGAVWLWRVLRRPLGALTALAAICCLSGIFWGGLFAIPEKTCVVTGASGSCHAADVWSMVLVGMLLPLFVALLVFPPRLLWRVGRRASRFFFRHSGLQTSKPAATPQKKKELVGAAASGGTPARSQGTRQRNRRRRR